MIGTLVVVGDSTRVTGALTIAAAHRHQHQEPELCTVASLSSRLTTVRSPDAAQNRQRRPGMTASLRPSPTGNESKPRCENPPLSCKLT